MKKLFLLSPVLLVAIIMASCSSPNACFVVSADWDSIHVNKPYVFDAGCSSKSGEAVWQFQGPGDSTIYYNKVVTKTFTDTGNFNVELVIVRSNKTGAASRSFKVRP